ncbi:MAG: ATP-dependent Clp protease adaptor protein ClpS [Polyangiales bacterium]|jgi:ATP-dependent Clp protease adaptor protein ClpS
MPNFEDDQDTDVITRSRPAEKVKRPRLYKVLMHNDDYTTREFVVWVLQTIYRKSEGEAVRVMMHVHQSGLGVAGLYTREVAETKVSKTERLAREHEFPLMMTMEPEDGDED